MLFQIVTGLTPFGTNIIKIYNRALKAKLELPPGVSEEARDLIFKMVVLDPNARLGGSDVRDIRSHKFFAASPLPKRSFEGAHRLSAPTLTLEACCLRAMGHRWASSGEHAAEFCSAHKDRLRDHVHATIARYQRIRELALAEEARKERQGLSSDSDKE